MPESRRGLNVNSELGHVISVDQSENSVVMDHPMIDRLGHRRGSMNVGRSHVEILLPTGDRICLLVYNVVKLKSKKTLEQHLDDITDVSPRIMNLYN